MGLPESTPLPPPTIDPSAGLIATEATGVVPHAELEEEQHSGSGHNLLVDPQELAPGGDHDGVNVPPAGILNFSTSRIAQSTPIPQLISALQPQDGNNDEARLVKSPQSALLRVVTSPSTTSPQLDVSKSTAKSQQQILSSSETYVPKGGLPCAASADSILDYGQFITLSTGNFLCSAATANSTMDFSTKPIEDNVVDSPPSGRPRPQLSCSPSPLQPVARTTSPSTSGKVPQRKLYAENGGPTLPAGLRSKDPSDMRKVHQNSAPVLPCQPSTLDGVQMKRPQSLCICKANTTMSEDLLPPLPKRRLLSVEKLLNRPSVLETRLQDGRHFWTVAEKKSLKMQRRESLCQQSSSSCGYSRGPEIFKALEKMKSRSHS